MFSDTISMFGIYTPTIVDLVLSSQIDYEAVGMKMVGEKFPNTIGNSERENGTIDERRTLEFCGEQGQVFCRWAKLSTDSDGSGRQEFHQCHRYCYNYYYWVSVMRFVGYRNEHIPIR